MKGRAAVVIVHGDSVVLIKRRRAGQTYYLFPGGSIEPGETPEQAAVREAYEELGLRVRITRLLADEWHKGSQHFYFLAQVTGGEFGTGSGAEMSSEPSSARGSYEAVRLPLAEVISLDTRPKEMVLALYEGVPWTDPACR